MLTPEPSREPRGKGRPAPRPRGPKLKTGGNGHLIVSVNGEETTLPAPKAISAALHAVDGMPQTPLTIAAIRDAYPDALEVGDGVTIRSQVAPGEDDLDDEDDDD